MTLPPIPRHPEPHTYTWTKLELADIEAYGKKCFEAALAQPATRHIHENAAQLLIEYFICAELGLKNSPGFTTEKQGESASESHSWAFWILEKDTTSYLHEDGRIEWSGTDWEAKPLAQPVQPTATREAFEAFAKPLLGDNPNWVESADCELARQSWQAATAQERESCAKFMDDCGEFEHAATIRARSNDA